jgi:4-aminobutyrate aminotransferase
MPKGRLIQGVKQMMPDLVAVSSKGAWVDTTCGRKFLDFSSGIGVSNLGHCHEGVTKAVQKASATLVHAQMNIMRHKPMMDLIDKLASLPLSKKASLNSWFLWNSGSEAVEGAIKLARQATGKPNIITMNLGYHGRTFMAMGLTTSGTIYRSGFGPLPSGVFPTPFPYVSRGPYAQEAMEAPLLVSSQCGCSTGCVGKCAYYGRAPLAVAKRDVTRCLESIELMLRTQTSPSETAAILIEPILGEGGYVPPPPGFLSGLRALCDKHGMLLIADEVQTGFGRTGTWFASDWLDGGVCPDIIISAKGLANGYPLSTVGTRSELSAKQPGGSMGGTYGGNAVSCAASLAVFEAFEADNGSIFNNIKAREMQSRQMLADFDKNYPGLIREVRGAGLMIGVELESKGGFGTLAPKVAAECHKRDLILLSCGPYDTLRLIPPLNVTEHEINKGVSTLCDAILAATAAAAAAK